MFRITAPTSNGKIACRATEGGRMMWRHFCCGDVFSLCFFKVLGLLFLLQICYWEGCHGTFGLLLE